jgi:hypothetical protein
MALAGNTAETVPKGSFIEVKNSKDFGVLSSE